MVQNCKGTSAQARGGQSREVAWCRSGGVDVYQLRGVGVREARVRGGRQLVHREADGVRPRARARRVLLRHRHHHVALAARARARAARAPGPAAHHHVELRVRARRLCGKTREAVKP